MSRWFRHYAGMMRDDKLVRIALKTKQPIERVLWVWGAILESAAEIDNLGKFDFDQAEAAYFLRAKPATIAAIFAALEDAGHVSESSVCKWKNRQFQSDKSKDRVAAHRAKKRSVAGEVAGGAKEGNADVTLHGCYGNAPDTETDTELPLSKDNGACAQNSDRDFWANSKAYLQTGGVKNPGPMIGRWVKDHGKEATAAAITAAQVDRAVEPIPFIQKILRRKSVEVADGPDWGLC